jgi:hypothetical protein
MLLGMPVLAGENRRSSLGLHRKGQGFMLALVAIWVAMKEQTQAMGTNRPVLKQVSIPSSIKLNMGGGRPLQPTSLPICFKNMGSMLLKQCKVFFISGI